MGFEICQLERQSAHHSMAQIHRWPWRLMNRSIKRVDAITVLAKNPLIKPGLSWFDSNRCEDLIVGVGIGLERGVLFLTDRI